MKEILLTSSALILALLLLRQVFRNRISRRVQYALWLLVLVRLLVPVSLPGVDFSLLTAAEPVGQAVTQRLEGQMVYRRPLESLPEEAPSESTASSAQTEGGAAPGGAAAVPGGEASSAPEETYHFLPIVQRVVTAADLLTYLWIAGMVLMGLWLLATNLRFWRKLRKAKTPYSVEGCRYPVYLVESGLPSPCLFGLTRPSVYLTPAAVETPERLRHVIAHESAHARHGDPLWALLRGVCLTVWWFNPLVWAAAMASKADGELACDEAALRALGEAERVPYGRTLLSLIPVHSGPENPLLSATTMTAGKRQLKDRITRIAQGGQTRAAALFLVLALAAVICAVTFTGSKSGGADAGETVPLTGNQLAYFNEEFFNHDTVNNVVGLNIHNQFLTSLYEQPEDIDLFELFYCGTGRSAGMSEEELRQAGAFDESGSEICPTDKLAVADLDAVLLENTGLTLAETAGTGLEKFQYLPEYDAYYHTHGDTNYFHSVQIAAGERSGDTFRLYYPDSFARYEDADWLCVTLERQSGGSFWFVSNQPAEKPAIPTVYPAGDPVLTIPLTDLAPIEPEEVAVTHRQNDCAERGGGILITTPGGQEYSFRPYRSTDGQVYAALINYEAAGSGNMAQWDVWTFFTYPEGRDLDSLTLDSFSLFGCTGVVISYSDYITGGPGQGGYSSTFHDYYAVADDGALTFLLRAYSIESPQIVDLDGDGAEELTASTSQTAQLFFQRDGQIYEADIGALLQDAWPEAEYLEFDWWDASRRCLSLWGGVPFAGHEDTGATGTAFRWVYFDGADLLFYKDTDTYTDHVADSIDVPEAVLDAARTRVLSYMEQFQEMAWNEDYTAIDASPEWDDWRITSLKLVDEAPAYPDLGIKVYGLGFKLHTPIPERVMPAGGTYIDEDGWVGGMYVESPYLVFHTMTSSGPTLLENHIPSDVGNTSDSPVFAACLAQTLLENDLLTPSQVRDADLYYLFYNNQSVFLNLMGTYDAQEQEHAMQALTAYAVSIAGTPDDDLLELGLQNLAWNSSALTEAGRDAYERLLGIVNGEAEPPTEADIQAAILSYVGSSSLAAYDDDYYAVAHRVLDQSSSFNTQTVYLMLCYRGYVQRDGAWTMNWYTWFPAAITFVSQNGSWQAQDYHWGFGDTSVEELKSVFPPEAAETALNDSELRSELYAQCGRIAEEYMAQHPASSPEEAPVFTKADVEFTGQALSTSTDEMTYEERLTWIQTAEYTPESFYLPLGDMVENQGYLAYTGQWVGTPHTDQYGLNLRFPDGTLASLPLPFASEVAIARPNTMEFSGDTFVYTVVFSSQEVTNEGQSLIHLAGTYRYTVDLAARTVSLAVTES